MKVYCCNLADERGAGVRFRHAKPSGARASSCMKLALMLKASSPLNFGKKNYG